jgi:hypothetical protein
MRLRETGGTKQLPEIIPHNGTPLCRRYRQAVTSGREFAVKSSCKIYLKNVLFETLKSEDFFQFQKSSCRK